MVSNFEPLITYLERYFRVKAIAAEFSVNSWGQQESRQPYEVLSVAYTGKEKFTMTRWLSNPLDLIELLTMQHNTSWDDPYSWLPSDEISTSVFVLFSA